MQLDPWPKRGSKQMFRLGVEMSLSAEVMRDVVPAWSTFRVQGCAGRSLTQAALPVCPPGLLHAHGHPSGARMVMMWPVTPRTPCH